MLIGLNLLCITGLILVGLKVVVKHRRFWLILMGIVLIGSQGILIANVNQHWGAHIQTTQTTQSLYSLATMPGDNHVLVFRNVGSGKNQKQIYVATNKSNGKQKVMTYSDGATIQIRRNVSERAKRVKSVQRWVYDNRFAQFLFAGVMNNQQVKRTTISYRLPSNWYLMTSQQLGQAASELKQQQAALKASVTEQVKLAAQPGLAANPAALKQIKNQAMQQFVGKILAKNAVMRGTH
ncbi:DUF4811 domain-containing protein [Furfurilactobacillus curtus]|uniref:DUF4811 domain-containing protein n=1 Tax=Furfurilactobacillus curtus TaxID=1746200 RepID=A0ABQ5JMZ4_9LACO